MFNESKGTSTVQFPVSNSDPRTDVLSSKNTMLTECGKTPKPVPSSPPNLTTPLFAKRRETQEGAKIGKENSSIGECSKTSEQVAPVSSPNLFTPSFLKKRRAQEGAIVGKEQPEQEQTVNVGNRRLERNLGEGKKVGEVPQVQPLRPSNPFAKSSTNQEKSSLLDSIKKMKKLESPS